MIKEFIRAAFIALLTCVISVSALGREKFQGFAEYGGQTVSTAGFTSSTKVQRSYPGSTVTVYLTGTTTLATIYSDDIGTAKANPFTSDSAGFWFFWADNTAYDIRFSGGGISTPFTLTNVGSAGSAVGLGSIVFSQYADRGDGAVAINTGTGTVAVTNGSATVTGTSTAFTTQLEVGDILKIGGVDSLFVRTITNDTSLTISRTYPGGTSSGLSWTYRMPYSDWEDAVPSPCSYKSFVFGAGVFVTPLLDMATCTQTRVYGVGSGASQVVGISSGNVMEFNTGAPTGYEFGIVLEHLWIRSIGQATNAVHLESVHHSTFYDLKITDVTNAGIYQAFGVANAFRSIRITGNEADQVVTPAYGIYFDRRDPAETSTTAELSSIHIDQTTNTGIHFEHMGGANLTNVVVEGNSGKGVVAASTTHKIFSAGLHLESNTGDDLTVDGYNHEFPATFCDGNVIWDAVHGKISGEITTLTLTGSFNTYEVLHSLTGSGGITDTGIGNIRLQTGPSSTLATAVDANRFNGNVVFRTNNGAGFDGSDPGYTEFMERRYNTISTTPQNLSDTVYATGKPWRVLFTGYFQDVSIGPTLAMQPLIREVTSANPSFVVGNRTVTVSQTVGGVMQIAADALSSGFAGTVHIIVGNYATGLSTTSVVTPGRVQSGGSIWDAVLFANLGTPSNGTFLYCSDCTKATPCASGGNGALAKRLNGAWDCD